MQPVTNLGAALIKRIELFNFMSHEHSVLELAEGLTVLIGPNNCGKSAIVTALQTVCQYESSKFMLRHGERECLVRIETAAGDLVEWSRTKSGSPMYKINGEQFDRLNRTVPKQLHEVLRMPLVDCDDPIDVHFGEQKSPTFLLNDKPTAAAQFFASTSDTSRLFAMQRLHRQRVNDRKKESKRLKEEQKQLATSLEVLEPLDEIRDEIAASEIAFQKLTEGAQQLDVLQQTIDSVTTLQQQCSRLKTSIQILDSLTSPPVLAPVEPLDNTLERLGKLTRNIDTDQQIAQALTALDQPPELTPVNELEFVTQTIFRLQTEQTQLRSKSNSLESLKPIPEFSSDTELENLIVELQKIEHRRSEAEKKLATLGQIAPPEIPYTNTELGDLIDQITQQSIQAEKLRERQNQIAELTENLDRKIDQWLEQNPICPTCGQPATREPWEHFEQHASNHSGAESESTDA